MEHDFWFSTENAVKPAISFETIISFSREQDAQSASKTPAAAGRMLLNFIPYLLSLGKLEIIHNGEVERKEIRLECGPEM